MLAGSAYFDFGPRCLQFHDLVERALEENVNVMLRWKALAAAEALASPELDDVTRLLAAHEIIRDRNRQRRFRQAVFAMVHRHGDDPADPVTLRTGVKMAGMDWGVVEEAIVRTGIATLAELRQAAEDAGVVETPSIVTVGPALAIELTGAAATGPPRPKLDLIQRMAGEDGIWSLRKPPTR